MLRKFDNDADGAGAVLILIAFMISIVLTFVAYTLGDVNAVGTISIYTPEHYDDMSAFEREQWLWEAHGGEPEHVWKTEITWSINFFGQWYRIFPDGYELTDGQYDKFVNGDASETDYYQIVVAILTLNPPLLESIGIAGLLIRIILIVMVAIGLVELIWIG